MGDLFSKNKSHTTRAEGYSSLSPSYGYGGASHRSYPSSSWSSTPTRPSTGGYSVSDSNTKRYAGDSFLNAASNERYGDVNTTSTASKGDAAPVKLKSYGSYVAPAVGPAAERNCAICSVKPGLTSSHALAADLRRTASNNISTNGSNPTGSWASAPSRSSVPETNVDQVSTEAYSAGGDKTKSYAAGRVPYSASYKRNDYRHAKPASVTSCASAAPVESATYSVKPVLSKRHANGNCRSASTTRNDSANDGNSSRRVATYGARGGGRVVISVPLNPWQVLGLHSSGVSREAVKTAFKRKITQPVRQNRAMVSIAHHMLTSSAGRYTRINGKDEFIVRRRDHFMLAACGHTKELTLRIDKKEYLVQDRDEHGRTLLYIASKSGFYDTCMLLLQKGSSVNEAQRDGSTPLHGAAYFGHELVVALLLQHGARSDVKNKWGNTALDESATPKIRSLIQTALADGISSLAASLKEKQLVLSVRLIKYQGEVIAKELTRDPRTLDVHTRAEWNSINSTWETAWHGTRYNYLQSIIEKGLLPAGSSGIKPAAGHYSLGEEHFGIVNWAAAIFLSPSILYAAHACYSERIFSESQQWCVLVKAYCKPGSYKSYDPTVFRYKPMDGEPDMPEYRVPVTEADKNVILRVESTRSVVVKSLMFVRLGFLENQDINFEKAMALLR